jgi:pyochelin biosynthesis protein PchC
VWIARAWNNRPVSTIASRVLRRIGPADDRAGLRIICCPHAGGSASFFREWRRNRPETVEMWAVQYPGHEDRVAEPHPEDLRAFARELAAAVTPLLGPDVLVFGHSMGAIVAYEVVRELERAAPDARLALGVSAALTPGRWRARFDLDSEEELVANLSALDAATAEVLADPDMSELIVPVARADLRALDQYRPGPDPVLASRIVALAADADPGISVDDVRLWQTFTSGRFDLHVFPGGHFYLTPQRIGVVTTLTAAAGA